MRPPPPDRGCSPSCSRSRASSRWPPTAARAPRRRPPPPPPRASPTCCPPPRRPAPTTSPAGRPPRTPRRSCSSTARSRARPTTGLTVSPQIKAAGYCVFALDYGDRGTGDIAASAGQLQRFVDARPRRDRRAQGLARRPLAGRHDAALVPQVPRRRGKVDDLVGLAPSNHGTTNPGALVAGDDVLPGVRPAARGSAFLQHLNAGDETPGAVSYTVVETRYDEVVTPFTSAFLAAGPNTANILLQDACPADVIDHHVSRRPRSRSAGPSRRSAGPGPADPAHPPSCA